MPDPRRRSKYSKEQIEAFRKRKIEQAKKARKERKGWHWFLTLHIIGLILGLISIFWLSSMIIISVWEMALIVLVVGVISLLAQYKYFKKKKIIREDLQLYTPLYVSYNMLGIGFIGLFLFFILNQSFSSLEIIQETYKIVGTDPEYKIYRWGSAVYLLEDDVFANDVYLRALPYKYYSTYAEMESPHMEYDFRLGLFGYKIKVDHRLAKAGSGNE